jgi:hypothetical protein
MPECGRESGTRFARTVGIAYRDSALALRTRVCSFVNRARPNGRHHRLTRAGVCRDSRLHGGRCGSRWCPHWRRCLRSRSRTGLIRGLAGDIGVDLGINTIDRLPHALVDFLRRGSSRPKRKQRQRVKRVSGRGLDNLKFVHRRCLWMFYHAAPPSSRCLLAALSSSRVFSTIMYS